MQSCYIILGKSLYHVNETDVMIPTQVGKVLSVYSLQLLRAQEETQLQG